MTRNIQATNPGPAIEIVGTGTESFDVDLNGFTISHTGDDVITVSNVRRLTIRNGSITGGNGFDGLDVEASGLSDGKVVIEGIKFKTGDPAITLNNVANFLVRRNLAIDFVDHGISVGAGGPGSLPGQGVIEENDLRSCSILAFSASENLIIRRNRVETSGGAISTGGNGTVVVADNVVSVTGGKFPIIVNSTTNCRVTGNQTNGGSSGLQFTSSRYCLVEGNVTTGADNAGIRLRGAIGFRVVNNVASGNDIGITLIDGAARNTLEDNLTTDNTTWGIYFDPSTADNRIGRNSSTGNVGVPASCANPGPATCGAPDLCDEGTANISFGDNLVPGLPPC